MNCNCNSAMFKHVRASPNKVDECTVFFEQKWASVKCTK